jgi:hypothetical protein
MPFRPLPPKPPEGIPVSDYKEPEPGTYEPHDPSWPFIPNPNVGPMREPPPRPFDPDATPYLPLFPPKDLYPKNSMGNQIPNPAPPSRKEKRKNKRMGVEPQWGDNLSPDPSDRLGPFPPREDGWDFTPESWKDGIPRWWENIQPDPEDIRPPDA